MTNVSYANGTAVVTTTRALLVNAPQENAGTVVQNRGPASVYVGGSSVTADQTSTGGVELEPGEKLTLPSVASSSFTWDLYAVTADGTATVSFLAAQ
jgi:hypothetical protein